MIVSNDINLINKSIISQIDAINFAKLKSNLENLIKNSKISKEVCTGLIKTNENFGLEDGGDFEDIYLKNFTQDLSQIFEEILGFYVVESLSYFLEFEMKKAYDNVWYKYFQFKEFKILLLTKFFF